MIRLFEMFAGYGGASFALKKAGVDFECVGYSEIDKFAIQCYEQNHTKQGYVQDSLLMRKVPNFGDCTKIVPEELPDFDLLTGGFPCQSFSVAGKGKGELDPRGTLFFDIIRIAEVKKPKYMLLENVKGLTTKKHKATFDKMLSELDRIGYHVHHKVLNSKDFGIPQNRERVFFACFRKGSIYNNPERAWWFYGPKQEDLKIFLKDILEEEVEEKYFLKEETLKKLVIPETSYYIDANYYKGTNVKGYLDKKRRQIIQVNNPKHSNDRVYSSEGVSPILNSMGGGNRQPFIVASRGRNPDNPSDRRTGSPTEQRLEPKLDGTTNTISTVQKDNYVFDGRIRKLTPTECFRLMGFLNDEINLEGLSNTQKYKLAGNGWDVNLVSKIFKKMFEGDE